MKIAAVKQRKKAKERCVRCSKLESENKQLLAAAKAYRDLCVCYRVGRKPSEALFARLGKAKEMLFEKTKKGG